MCVLRRGARREEKLTIKEICNGIEKKTKSVTWEGVTNRNEGNSKKKSVKEMHRTALRLKKT